MVTVSKRTKRGARGHPYAAHVYRMRTFHFVVNRYVADRKSVSPVAVAGRMVEMYEAEVLAFQFLLPVDKSGIISASDIYGRGKGQKERREAFILCCVAQGLIALSRYELYPGEPKRYFSTEKGARLGIFALLQQGSDDKVPGDTTIHVILNSKGHKKLEREYTQWT